MGEIWLAPTGVTDVHFPNPPPPLLARCDGAMTTGIQSPPVPPLPPTVVVFMSGLFRLHRIAHKKDQKSEGKNIVDNSVSTQVL